MRPNYLRDIQFDPFPGENGDWSCLLLETQTTNIPRHFLINYFTNFPAWNGESVTIVYHFFIADSSELSIVCQTFFAATLAADNCQNRVREEQCENSNAFTVLRCQY